jgi:hypothetical protein
MLVRMLIRMLVSQPVIGLCVPGHRLVTVAEGKSVAVVELGLPESIVRATRTKGSRRNELNRRN